jgi:hypothetical protein
LSRGIGSFCWPGTGTFKASEIVGIGRKTGYRWRAENGGLPPARLAEAARSGRYLSLLERQRIGIHHRSNMAALTPPLPASSEPGGDRWSDAQPGFCACRRDLGERFKSLYRSKTHRVPPDVQVGWVGYAAL